MFCLWFSLNDLFNICPKQTLVVNIACDGMLFHFFILFIICLLFTFYMCHAFCFVHVRVIRVLA